MRGAAQACAEGHVAKTASPPSWLAIGPSVTRRGQAVKVRMLPFRRVARAGGGGKCTQDFEAKPICIHFGGARSTRRAPYIAPPKAVHVQ